MGTPLLQQLEKDPLNFRLKNFIFSAVSRMVSVQAGRYMHSSFRMDDGSEVAYPLWNLQIMQMKDFPLPLEKATRFEVAIMSLDPQPASSKEVEHILSELEETPSMLIGRQVPTNAVEALLAHYASSAAIHAGACLEVVDNSNSIK